MLIALDLASKKDETVLYINSKKAGKSIVMQKLIDAYIKQNPDITVRYSDGRIEKPVKGKHD